MITTFSTLEKLRSLQRELALRRNLYAKRDGGPDKLTPQHQREIALFEDIARDYAERLTEEQGEQP